MKRFITGSQIANLVRMVASHHKGTFLIVEGDTDARIYEAFVDGANCQVIVGHCKSNVLQAMNILANTGLPILAIVDSDYWKLQSMPSPSHNVLVTDTHDLETMMLRTQALEKVLRELGTKAKLEQFERTKGRSIRDVVLEAGMPVGLARWISERDGLSLKFKDIDFVLFIDIALVETNLTALVDTVLSNTTNPSISKNDLQAKISKEQVAMQLDVWHVCCGHDLVSILSIALQKAIGGRFNPKEVSKETVERHLRLAYEFEFFKSSQLYLAIHQWQEKNKPYKILRG
jgi:hypothetical protein